MKKFNAHKSRIIPILYEGALNHIEVQEIRMRNEPQRTQRKKLKGFGEASQRNLTFHGMWKTSL